MTTVKKIGLLLLLSSTILVASANQMQKYGIKSGKVEYSIKGSGNIMGMVTIKKIGKKRVIFDNYGVKNLTEERTIEKKTTQGKTDVNKQHTMTYMNDAILYRVNFKKKRIVRIKNMGAAMAMMMDGNKNAQATGEAMMKKMGGKKVGTDTVLGYQCDVWSMMGTKQCLYKGLPLKIEMDIMGMKSIEVATKAEFGLSLDSGDFKLPDFSLYDERMKKLSLDRSNLDAMDAKQSNASKNKSAESAAALAAMLQVVKEAGADKNGKITPEQKAAMQQAMQKAVMKSMGGEKGMVDKMKKEMLESEKGLDFAEKCLGSANRLKEANRCIDQGNQMFDEDEEHLSSWTEADKREFMREIKQFKKALPCIKAAQTMQAIQGCIPKEMR